MAVRAFYWDNPIKNTDRRLSILPKKASRWRAGNVGDIYNRDLMRHLYGEEAQNISDAGKRLLLVGSIVHTVREGDIVVGAGTKGSRQPAPTSAPVRVLGVRGPLTAAKLRDSGYDLSELAFMLDPGLLIGDVYPQTVDIEPVAEAAHLFPIIGSVPSTRAQENLTSSMWTASRLNLYSKWQSMRRFTRRLCMA